jgi:16S rRNA (cytosine1407-C5)-methyltransferase
LDSVRIFVFLEKLKAQMELTTYLKKLLTTEYDAFCAAVPEPPCVAVNSGKCQQDVFRQKLNRWGLNADPHPVARDSFILADDPLPLSHTLSYFLGEFRHQGISSLMPALALDPQPGETILDMAAAPGSKSVQIAGLMQNRGRLLLNDVYMKRVEPLMTNLSRAAVLNDVLVNLPGQTLGRLLPEFFDRILVDAPCSGLNLIDNRKQDGHWNSGYLETISHVQEQLLISAIKAAKVNGVIVYSTCSLAPEENEMVVSRILEKYPVEVESLPNWRLTSSRPAMTQYGERSFPALIQHGLRLYPFPENWEGFFLIRLRKTAPLTIRPVDHPMSWIATLAFDDPTISPILENLQKLWGVDVSFFAPFRFWVNEHKLWLVNDEWRLAPQNGFVKIGLPLAVRKSGFWRLTTASSQWLNERITRNRLEIAADQLTPLLASGELSHEGNDLKYYILTTKQRVVGVVSQYQGKLKLKIPHPFRLVADADVR